MSEKVLVKLDYALLSQIIKSIEGHIRMFRVSKNIRDLDVIESLTKKLYASIDTPEAEIQEEK